MLKFHVLFTIKKRFLVSNVFNVISAFDCAKKIAFVKSAPITIGSSFRGGESRGQLGVGEQLGVREQLGVGEQLGVRQPSESRLGGSLWE